MPNIGSVFKSEISRVARKEVRGETQALKQAISQYRTQISDLKRRMQALEKQVARQGKATSRGAASRAASEPADGEDTGSNLRFSAKGLATHRKRLGLSAAALAKILGVSALSVYKWESGKVRPRAKQIEAIASLRTMGKREAAERLGQ
jgi:DNA-binding transcriptional regulator YiaG